MNLGAILHLNGKLQEAEANYLRALQLKPDDTITQSNLRKLWNIMEKQGLRTTSPWPYPARLPAICTPDLGEKDGLHARHLLLSSRKDGRDSGRLFAQRALLKAPELCIHLRPAALLRSIVHSLAGATEYLDSLGLSSKLVLSQEPRFFLIFFVLL